MSLQELALSISGTTRIVVGKDTEKHLAVSGTSLTVLYDEGSCYVWYGELELLITSNEKEVAAYIEDFDDTRGQCL